jgi:hypothetical protein
MESVSLEPPTPDTTQSEPSANAPVTSTALDSPAIRRLMEEVRCEDSNSPSGKLGYDRAHNRHNRS